MAKEEFRKITITGELSGDRNTWDEAYFYKMDGDSLNDELNKFMHEKVKITIEPLEE